ncbi:MAG: hypothetical protein ACJASX_001969 [Limisphaerales bacterium]|jgi:hypothetical protein
MRENLPWIESPIVELDHDVPASSRYQAMPETMIELGRISYDFRYVGALPDTTSRSDGGIHPA